MPAILISVQSGSIVQVSSMIRDLSARVIDLDLAHEGKPATADVPHRLYGVPILADDDAEPALSPEEIERFAAEIPDLSKLDTITLFANIAATVPGGTAALRDWLREAEAETNTVWCEGEIVERDGFRLCTVCDTIVTDPPTGLLKLMREGLPT